MDNAFELAVEDEWGNEYSESYWYPTFQGTDWFSKTARCEFTGWKNKQSFLDKQRPIPGMKRSYSTSGEASFFRLKEWYEAQNPMPNVYAVCVMQALMAQEIGDAPVGEEEDTRTSFFANATVV